MAIALIVAVAAFASAQAVFDVTVETDEFTGVQKCYQTVAASDSDQTGMTIMYARNAAGNVTTVTAFIFRGLVLELGPAFSASGLLPNDRVYLRLPDGAVRQYVPYTVVYRLERRYEGAAIELGPEVYDLVRASGDLRVRFSGVNGNKDFTIPHSVLVALGRGFGSQCLP